MSICLLIVSAVLAQFSPSLAWTYKEQDKWPLLCHKGITQSPIDLVTSKAIPVEGDALVGKNWDKDYNVTIKNKGYTVLITPDTDDQITLSGGGLPGTFIEAEFHFHWNSEHTIDGQRKAFEAYHVLYNDKFDSLEEAVRYEGGIVTLSILYKLSEEPNERLVPIVAQLEKLKNVHSSSKLNINLRNYIPDNLSGFYRYWGSNSMPDCQEVVVWTIFAEYSHISQEQIDAFASVKAVDGTLLTKNYRKTQPMNGRILLKYSTGPSF